MVEESAVTKKRATAILAFGIVGLWPIVFIAIMWALAQWGGAGGEFSLAPRETMRNVVILVVALAVTLALDVGVIVFALRALRRKRPGRGRALAGMVMAACGTLAILAVVGFGIAISLILGGGGDDKLSKEERVRKCRSNQEKIAIMLGPEMWGFDHPDAKPSDLEELDLSPRGDLVEPEDGPAYTTDPSVFDCPADDDADDVDYAVYITPEGEVKVTCVDPEGIKEGHNE
jgi:hypothetical protein